jgi:hypothetical protein
VSLPTPVVIAGGAVCLVAGYLIGTVAGPSTPHPTTATVVSFEAKTSHLCLEGKAVKDDKSVDSDGVLCGVWSHSTGASLPRKGDKFQFVAQDTATSNKRQPRYSTVLYGTVVK